MREVEYLVGTESRDITIHYVDHDLFHDLVNRLGTIDVLSHTTVDYPYGEDTIAFSFR